MLNRFEMPSLRRVSRRRTIWTLLALLSALATLALPSAVRAASFSVSFDQDAITIGESVTMTMTFDGGRPDAIPAPPSVPGLRIEDLHSDMTSMQIINGQITRRFSHTFQATPTQTGVFEIPSMAATIEGQPCKSDPLKLTVTAPGAPPPGVNAENPEIAFMRLEVPKQSFYVGEVIRAELQLYLRDGIMRISDFQMNPPQAEGFTVGKTTETPHRQATVGNHRYTVVPLTMAYIPVKVGSLTIGSSEGSMNLLMGPLDFFGRPTHSQHLTLTNQAVNVQVLPLPTDNVPPGFSGAVGHYSMALSVSPTNVAIGDPVTVKVDITGVGSMDGLRLPTQMGWQQFKLYPPTSEFHVNQNDPLGVSGTMHFALTAVPESMDVHELPPFVFTYFDPDRKTYQTLSHPAVPLTVRPSAASLPAPTFSNISSSDNPGGGQDVSPIKPRFGALAQLTPPLVWQPWFLALQTVPVLAWVSLLIRRKQQERLANNPRLRRQRQVEQTVRGGLKQLREAADAGRSEEFFATVFRLLQEQLGERLDTPASGITEAVLDERLRPMAVPETQLSELRELFLLCNEARYAREATHAELISLIPRVETALHELRKVKA